MNESSYCHMTVDCNTSSDTPKALISSSQECSGMLSAAFFDNSPAWDFIFSSGTFFLIWKAIFSTRLLPSDNSSNVKQISVCSERSSWAFRRIRFLKLAYLVYLSSTHKICFSSSISKTLFPIPSKDFKSSYILMEFHELILRIFFRSYKRNLFFN